MLIKKIDSSTWYCLKGYFNNGEYTLTLYGEDDAPYGMASGYKGITLANNNVIEIIIAEDTSCYLDDVLICEAVALGQTEGKFSAVSLNPMYGETRAVDKLIINCSMDINGEKIKKQHNVLVKYNGEIYNDYNISVFGKDIIVEGLNKKGQYAINLVNIESENSFVLEDITANFNTMTTPTIPRIELSNSGKTASVVIPYLTEPKDNILFILAGYKKHNDGAMILDKIITKKFDITGEKRECISISIDDGEYDTIRTFLWEGDSLKPIQ